MVLYFLCKIIVYKIKFFKTIIHFDVIKRLKLNTFSPILLKISDYRDSIDIRFMSWKRLFACSISNIPQLKIKNNCKH